MDVSYETVRRSIAKFGPQIAHTLRRRQARLGDVWYLDEVVVKCSGTKFWLWRAVEQHGIVLEEILQMRRDKKAAKRFVVTLMKRYGFIPKRIVTDKLRSYGAAKADVAPSLNHWSHRGSITELRIVTFRFENGSELCKATDRRERCNGSFPCILPLAIAFQFHPTAVPQTQFVTIVSKRSKHGKLQSVSTGYSEPRIRLAIQT